MMTPAVASIVLLAWGAAPAAPTAKVAMMPLSAGEGVPDKTAAALTDVAVAEMRKFPNLQVITQQELATLVSFDKQRSVVGCKDDSCVAEIGGALGVDQLAFGTVAKLGESWLVTVKLVDVKKVKTLAQADRRIKKGTVDDVLDQIPSMVAEIFGNPETMVKPEPARLAAPSAPAKKPLSPNFAEEPYDLSKIKDRLKLATDGKGRYVAYVPFWDEDRVLFAGDGKVFTEQRVYGGGAEGQDAFSFAFWEPRVSDRSGGGFALDMKGAFKLECGKKAVELKPVPAGEAKKLVAKAKFLKPWWRRSVFAVLRDDQGNYYLADQERDDDAKDFHLYVGTKGKLEPQELRDAIVDEKGALFVTPAGRLKIVGDTAEWLNGALRTPLTMLDLKMFATVRTAYRELGVYPADKLGTACDGLM